MVFALSSLSRLADCQTLSQKLKEIGDSHLASMISTYCSNQPSIGGQSGVITVDGAKVFVKRIKLTALESEPGTKGSTRNLFELPLFYQYGIGSSGFNAWRELRSHQMANEWVSNNECPNFPLLLHWFVQSVPPPSSLGDDAQAAINEAVHFWEENDAVRKRLEALHFSPCELVLFLEYFPQTLNQWLADSFVSSHADDALSLVVAQIDTLSRFLRSKGLIHFDGHFDNVLTDGRQIFLSDFGLALHESFDLNTFEREFFARHLNYDRASFFTSLVYCLLPGARQAGTGWGRVLQSYLNDKPGELPPDLEQALRQYAPVALTMADFKTSLRQKSKSTPYPSEQMELLLNSHGILS